MSAKIRRIEARDEQRWRELWDGYCRFYEREPAPAINDHTWKRLRDAASPVHGIVAEEAGRVIGIANYIIHENTSTLTPVCYLQDLFVDPTLRAGSVGKQLIDWLESPVIKRFQDLTPNIQRSLSERLVNETRAQVEPKLTALEAAMAKQLGVTPASAAGAPGPAPAAAMPGNRGASDSPRK